MRGETRGVIDIPDVRYARSTSRHILAVNPNNLVVPLNCGFLVGAEGSNPRPSPCKGESGCPGQRA